MYCRSRLQRNNFSDTMFLDSEQYSLMIPSQRTRSSSRVYEYISRSSVTAFE